ncbi:MAG: DMT family transporter [Burkholderiales bacterium]|jgi:drug/metabolite transporter (DMT)-like permease|nr:DMT family transporter [Burkholderiales bacterium]
MSLSAPTPSQALATANRRGITAMMLSAMTFVANDALLKYASQSLPGMQAIFLRGVFATLFLLMLCQAMGVTKHFNRLGDRRLLTRSCLDAVATLLYLTALFHLPLGNATAINMAAPLFIMLFAVLVLREQAGFTRWAALAGGFAGVLLIVQPAAEGFNAWALLSVVGTVLHAARDLLTRFIDRSIPTLVLTLSTMIAVMVLSGIASIFQGWAPVGWTTLGCLMVAAVFLGAGHYFLAVSMRTGELSLIAPFRYSGLLFALFIGWTVWGDVPNALATVGIVLLVGAGLYVLLHERARQRQRQMLETAAGD